jgi:phospholipid/cholesterol/gamma-HCH transport system ATP-binding protein
MSQSMAHGSERGSGEPVIQLSGIHKSFRSNDVLRGVDLTLPEGGTVAILGVSGSGKSVLLKVLIGLLPADQGQVRLFGTDATRLPESGWEALRRRVGMLFQGGALFDSMSVGDNVAFPLQGRKVDPARIQKLVEERLEWVELPGIADRSPSQLSGGMRKRVALARAIATDPELILYDEPTSGLDPLTGLKISELIKRVNDRLGSTSIVVTHDLTCATIVARRWIFIHGGHILFDGPPDRIRTSGPPEVREFLAAGRGLDNQAPLQLDIFH